MEIHDYFDKAGQPTKCKKLQRLSVKLKRACFVLVLIKDQSFWHFVYLKRLGKKKTLKPYTFY